jgi:hypothetical protein
MDIIILLKIVKIKIYYKGNIKKNENYHLVLITTSRVTRIRSVYTLVTFFSSARFFFSGATFFFLALI